jgi:DNA-directed RNA polymerase specialized sigma24 family protein
VGEHELWLTRRAAAGDETAFGELVEASRAKIHGLISSFVNTDYRLEREDAYQIAVTAAWRSLQSGRYNPHHGDFYSFVSMSARHRLITYAEHLRAECRWTGQPPDQVEVLEDGVHQVVLGSWVSLVDPLRVVLARDELRRCLALLTAHQLAAINDYMARGGQHVPPRTQDAICRVRRKVKPMLEDPYGIHPTLPTDRTCAHCGGSLAGEDIRARVHRRCRSAWQWQRELLDHSQRQPPALRLV